MKDNYSILLTIDVEDWFQVEKFKLRVPFSSWSSRELRVEKNTHRLLNLFDSIKTNSPKKTTYELSAVNHDMGFHGTPKATFFVLGWIDRRLPHLIQEIHSRGHEVASHGNKHDLCVQLSKSELKKDLKEIDSLYIYSSENRQSTFFYLSLYSKGKVRTFENINQISNEKGIYYVITFDNNRYNILKERKDYKLVKAQNIITALFVKAEK